MTDNASSPDCPEGPNCPDGIATRNVEEHGGRWNWVSLAVLGALMLAALIGAFGGGKSPVRVADGPVARFEIATPHTIRNGEFYEMRVRVDAKAPIAKAVLVVPVALWRDMTVNTMIPAASEEKAQGGAFRFDYGELKPGEILDLKFDGQINPALFAGTRGTIALADGERTLAEIPLNIRVLP